MPQQPLASLHSRVKSAINLSLEGTIKKLRQQITEREEFIERLIDTNNHQMKTAVNGIVGSTDLLTRDGFDVDRPETFQEMHKLSNDLLKRLEANLKTDQKLLEEPTDLAPNFERLAETLAKLGSPKSLYWDFTFCLFPKISQSTVIPDSENLENELKAILTSNQSYINPILEQEILQLTGAVRDQNNKILELMSQNTQEMRKTLTSIAMHSKTQEKSDTNFEELATLADLSTQLSKLFYEGLEFHKTRERSIVISNEYFDFIQLLQQINMELSDEIDTSKISLQFHIPEHMPPVLHGDANHIRKTIEHILSRSIENTEEGAIEVKISFQTDSGNILLYFEITDTGPPIEAKKMPHLFTPYLREGHQERITRRLFTAKSFIEFMGGEIIQVKSPNVDERGTSIAFSIPLKTGTLAELQLQDSKKDLMGKKILIVDDSQTNLKILKGLLERNGMTCVVIDGSTTGGKDSIDALIEANVKKKEHEHPFDLVLMDLQMPGMDGLQASREIRKIRKLAHLPIVALTGNDPQEYRAQSLEAGMNAFMEKPCQPKTLFPLMARLIDEAREKAHAWKSNKLRKSYSSKDATLIHAFDELPLATTINNLRIRDDHNMERIHPGAN